MNKINPRTLLLTDYEPLSVFKLKEHHPHKAKFRTIDMHAHPEFAQDTDQIRAWADRLEENNIERVVIHTYAFGDQFEELYDKFKSVSDKFEMWCGLNLDNSARIVETCVTPRATKAFYLTSRPFRVAARKLYASMGFKEEETGLFCRK